MNALTRPVRSDGPGSPVPLRGVAIDITPELVETFRAMACDITLRAVAPSSGARAALAEARTVFHDVERACTRFDPASPLMQANADPDAWHQAPVELYDALFEAYAAHRVTEGLFDPRVLRSLEAFGYDRSLPFAAGGVVTGEPPLAVPPGGQQTAWAPQFDEAQQTVRLGPDPVDLGGIGKGLAVRWAAERLAGHADSFMVEAGGDCYLGGTGPDRSGWRIAVEDPMGGRNQLPYCNCPTPLVRHRRSDCGSGDPANAGCTT